MVVRLPKALEGLDELALDLRWSWCHALDKIWRRLNSELWMKTRNPWLVLKSVSAADFEALAADEAFVSAVRDVHRRNIDLMTGQSWYERTQSNACACVAYFSMEYGISETLPIYAGGLGVLAGDYLKAASDLGVPIVAIGLFYQSGYFRQALDAGGSQLEFYPAAHPEDVPIRPAVDENGQEVRVTVPFPGRDIIVRAWRARIGRNFLYLLDTSDPSNSAADRAITAGLYGGSAEQRLQQELILGIGGWRLLRALRHQPEICHLNEGHAAFAIFEHARMLMEDEKISFDVALTATRPGNIFTTHTPLDAAFDRFDRPLAEEYLGAYARQSGVPSEQLLFLGLNRTGHFMPARVALRECGIANAVSRRHGEHTRRLFAGLFPRWPLAEIPIGYITNGVHTPSWDSIEADRVWEQSCGKGRWREDLSEMEQQIAAIASKELWNIRQSNRAHFVQFTRDRLAQQLRESGYADADILAVKQVFDPNALTIGFARRFATYKRPMLLLHDEERLARLLRDTERPVQIVVAGKAHPNDLEGKEMIRAWLRFVRRPDVRGRAVFLSDYDLLLAEELVQGVDLWINTPEPPWEACGTSGMKVLVNGGLNLSELDGWWAEAYSSRVGWAIETRPGPDGNADAARTLYECLEHEIVPTFYSRDADGVPATWVDRMRASMSTLTARFSTNRMVREYVKDCYARASMLHAKRTQEHCASASEILTWQRSIRELWPSLRFGESRIIQIGASYEYHVPCYLGQLRSNDVRVQVYADAVGAFPSECHAMEPVGISDDGATSFRAVLPNVRPITDYTVRAIPYHPDALVPLEASEITWLR